MENQFTAVYQKSGKWWVASVQELRGANTQGATLEEARENLIDAVALLLTANRELAEGELSDKEVLREQIVVITA